MAELDATSTPVPDATPAAEPAPAGAPVMESATPVGANNATAANAPAYGDPGAAASPSTVVPAGAPVVQPAAPQPHARLMAMIQGLGIGLSNFGKAGATGGREGGAQGVIQDFGAIARQKQEATAAQSAQKSAELQQKIAQGNLVQINAINHHNAEIMPDEAALSHMRVPKAQQEMQTGQVALQNARHESMQQFGTDPLAPAGPAGTAQNMAGATKVSEQLLKFASDNRVLGPDDPAVKDATAAIAKAQATGDPDQVVMAQAGLHRAIDFHQKAVDAGIKQQEQAKTAPLGAKADDLNKMAERIYQIAYPKASLPPEFNVSATSTPEDAKRVDGLLEKIQTGQNTKVNRESMLSMRQEMLDLQKGVDIPGDNSKTGPAYLESLGKESPAMAANVKQIIEGRGAPPPPGSRSPAAQRLLGMVNLADSGYDSTKYPAYLQAREKFTAGKQGDAVNALNTVEHHLARMYDHANSAFTSGGVTGRITGYFGDKDVLALGDDATALATELSKAYAGGQISEGEKNDWQKKLDIHAVGMTTGKLITNLKEIDGLLEGKQKANQDQWENAAPSAAIASSLHLISPQAVADRAHLRGEATPAATQTPAAAPAAANSLQVTASDGSVHTFKDQQGVDAFKKLAGIK